MNSLSSSKTIVFDIFIGIFYWFLVSNILFYFMGINGILGVGAIIISYLSTIISMIILLLKNKKWISTGIVVAVFINMSLWMIMVSAPFNFAIMVATCPLPFGYVFVMD
jgi:hypothetical protein